MRIRNRSNRFAVSELAICRMADEPPKDGEETPPGAGAGGAAPKPDEEKEALRAQLEAERLRAAKAEASATEKDKQIESERRAKLKEQEKYKELYEEAEKRASAAEEKSENLSKGYLNDKKMSAITAAAIRAGLMESAIDDLDGFDFSGVVVERTSTGRVNILGVEGAIKSLKEKKPHWFGKGQPRINGDMPGIGDPNSSSKVSVESILAAEAEARKTGEWSKVEALQKQFRAQDARA